MNLVLLSWLQSEESPWAAPAGCCRLPSPAAPGAHSPAAPSPQPQAHGPRLSDPPGPARQSPRRLRGGRGSPWRSPGASQEPGPWRGPACRSEGFSVTPSRLLFASGHLDPAERAGDARPKLWCALQAGRVVVFDASSWSLHQHCVRVGSSALVRPSREGGHLGQLPGHAATEGRGQSGRGRGPQRPPLWNRGSRFCFQFLSQT